MIDGSEDPYIENCIVFLNELKRAKRDASNFLQSGRCRTDSLRKTVTSILRYSKALAQQARDKKFSVSEYFKTSPMV